MSGEGLSVSFRRTSMTTKSNTELLKEFQKIVYASRVTTHMKWYGEACSVDIVEHGDEELQKWQQESVAIKDAFQFTISVYDSWHKDADLYESHKRDDSFVSLANEFAKDNWLHYYSQGFPSEWIETETIDGEKCWNHFIVYPDDKNIDKICKIWHDYGQQMVRAEQFGQSDNMKCSYWEKAREGIKSIMEKHDNYDYAI
jgi:hypothetical protein